MKLILQGILTMTDEKIYIWCEKGGKKSKKALGICQTCKNTVNCVSYKKYLLNESLVISNVGTHAQLDQEENWL